MRLPWNLLMLCAVGLGPVAVHGQFMPDAPVEGFKLFGFDEVTGWRVWELEGTSGTYVAEDSVQIADMTLRTFSPTEAQTTELRIDTPLATMDPKGHRARGDGVLQVTASSFYLSGEDWTWNGKIETLTVNRNAHLVIEGDVGALLK